MEDVYPVRLVVNRQDGGYRARWVEEDGQESESFNLDLPLKEEDAADLRWYLEKYGDFVGAGTRKRAQGIEARIETWGRQLFDACFGSAEGTHVYRNLLEASKADRPVLLTLGSDQSRFLQQPWELMRDRRGPLSFQGVSIRRQLIGAKPGAAKSLKFKLPLRLLMIVARPSKAGFIDPRSSMAPLLDALDVLPEGAVELEFCQPPTLSRLEELISTARKEKRPFHIVHFDGHGTYLPDTGVGALCFEKDDHGMDLVAGRRLGDLLSRLEIPLVMLEACRTSDLSDQPVFGSLAPALLESGVGSVVAFSHSVAVEASRILVERFYRELAAGLSVGQALSEARSALRANPRRPLYRGPGAATIDLQDWFIPQLYQVGADPVLPAEKLDPDKAVAVRARPERLSGFPPKPMYRFHGRAKDLLELERAFERHPAVLLTGGGGMGKTALAREAAWWWLRTGRFEQAVFVSFERTATVERVVQELGRALEGASFASRPGEEQQKVALQLFRERRVLLVWDNFESTLPQFQQGEEGGPVAYPEAERARLRRLYESLAEPKGAGRLLVTCRPVDAALPGIKEHLLQGLERPDSLHLVHAIADVKSIDLERKGYEREEMEKLLDLLGDHPLSLSLVGPHLKSLKPAEICADFAGLLDRFKDETAEEGRNKSLLASLAFSTSRLSEASRAVLPWMAWFQGGAFEIDVLRFIQLSPDAWSAIRAELEATALLRVEGVPGFTNPFLRFHPTLPYAARRQEVGEMEAAEQRFVAVYLVVMEEVDAALKGRTAAAGMALMEREEANFRSALEIAFRCGERQRGSALANTLGAYLQMAARLRERDALVDWVRAQMPEGEGLDGATCATIWQQALSLVGRGRAGEAVAMLQQLIARLEAEGLAGGEDLAFHLGNSHLYLGQVFVNANRPDLAIESSGKAIEVLGKMPDEAAQANFSTAMGDLANAYWALGRLTEALAAAERGLAIARQLGRERGVAAGIGQCAQILGAQERWAEADASYQEALALARRIGDLELQGTFLQHQGILENDRGNSARAAEFYEQAMTLFQQAGNAEGEMQTCDLLASAEQQRGQLDAAEAWYGRARELALALDDRYQLGSITQNVGILYQARAEQTADAESRAVWLRRALASIEESLAIKLERNNEVGAAASYFQLGVLHQMLCDLEAAEKNTRLSLEIAEALDQPELWKVYANLAVIVAARGDAAAAAEWADKRDAKLAELEQRHRGGGDGAGLAQLAEPLLALAQAVYASRASRSELDPQAAEAVATLCGLPSPLAEIGAFLRTMATGEESPPLPAGLPAELARICEGLREAISELPE
jgi:tetratricopeptide (TPR) repeat protein